MNNEEFDALITMVAEGRIARTEFLLKVQISASAVGAIQLLHQLPAAVVRNVDIAHLLMTDEETLTMAAVDAPKKRAIPPDVYWDAASRSFMNADGELGSTFYKSWRQRASEFPVYDRNAKPPIPADVVWDERDTAFRDTKGHLKNAAFFNTWVARASEFPKS